MTQVISDEKWTLFLDRDGVINKFSAGKYVNSLEDFEFCENAIKAIEKLGKIFNRIIVVTNQQGVSLGYIKKETVEEIHRYMLDEIRKGGGKVDRLYVCYDSPPSVFRKPETGMALAAQRDFPDIDFSKSIMVGDSESDMEFGKRLEMMTICILPDGGSVPESLEKNTDAFCYSLWHYANL